MIILAALLLLIGLHQWRRAHLRHAAATAKWVKKMADYEFAQMLKAKAVGVRCSEHADGRRCAREKGHAGTHDCGYSFRDKDVK